MSALYDQITSDPQAFYNNLPGAGSYQEGRIGQAGNALLQLKKEVQAGTLTLPQYMDVAEPLTKLMVNNIRSLGGGGSSRAKAANVVLSNLVNNGLLDQNANLTLPFSRTEYAKLSDKVLPTQDQVDKGLFDPNLAPINRLQAAPSPTDANLPGPNGGPNDGGQSTQDILNIVGNGQNGIDARTDQGKLLNQGDINAKQLAETLALQQQLKDQALTKYGQTNQDNLKSLAQMLSENQMNLFNRSVPDLAEQANTKGILKSTGFGDLLANKYSQLTQDTQQQLGLQGLNSQQQLAQMGYQNATDYANGLGDVVNTKIGAANSGLQRSFSLADYERQLQDAIKYGSAPQTSGPSKTSGAIQGGLMGATSGASVGGPMGALVGGGLGAVGGGQAAKKA